MAVQLIEGWEAGDVNVGIGGGGGNSISSTNTAGPWSDYSYASGVTGHKLYFRSNDKSEFYSLFKWAPNASGANYSIVTVQDIESNQVFRLEWGAAGLVKLYNTSNVLIATGVDLLFSGAVFNTIEVYWLCADAGRVRVRLHGKVTDDIDVSYDSKSSATTAFCNNVSLGSQGFWDDVVVYDTSGGVNDSWVGEKGVRGFRAAGKGDAEQLTPRRSGTVTRFYFPKSLRTPTTKDGYPAPVLPALDAVWEYTESTNGQGGNTIRGRLSPDKLTHTNPGNSVTDVRPTYDISGSAPWDLLGGQYVSVALAAQTLTGTFKMYMLSDEEIAADNVATQVVIKVVSNDGLTVRGTLYAGDTDTTNPPSNENNAGAEVNRAYPRGNTGAGQAISSLAISEGDRLVVEFGVRMRGASRLDVQNDYNTGSAGSTDVPENETDTTSTFNPWIEFSGAITLSDDGNWDHVNEHPKPDDDQTYVYTSVAANRDLYNLEDMDSGYIVSGPISVALYCKKVEPGSRFIRSVYKTSGAEQTNGVDLPVATGSYVWVKTYADVDATDAAAWNAAKLNSLQVGPKAI